MVKYKKNRYFRVFLMLAFIGLAALSYRWLNNHNVLANHDKLLSQIIHTSNYDNSRVYDRHGELIGEFFTRYSIFTPIEKVPSFMIKAVIATEDRRFFSHPGFDVIANLRAIVRTVVDQRFSQGASTITQQLVRSLVLTREKHIPRKIKEIILAWKLERRISKQKILEKYLNQLYLGSGSYGVAAAANRYFGKKIDQLNAAEMSLIVGLFQSPSRYNPHKYPQRAKRRQLAVLASMLNAGDITKNEFLKISKLPLKYKSYKYISHEKAPYFTDYVRGKVQELLGEHSLGESLRIYTTLDMRLQEMAQLSIDKAAQDLANLPVMSDQVNAATLSIDPRSGEILAMVGGLDYKASQFNLTTQSLRSPGSLFKPVVYIEALSRGKKWNDVELVAPISIDGYRPKNFGNNYLTETTLLRAFYLSLNTVAVDLGMRLGLSPIIERAKTLGVETNLKEEAGTFIGSSEVSMFDLSRMYSVIATTGQRPKIFTITKITDRRGEVIYDQAPASKPVLDPRVAFLMKSAMNQVLRRGTARRAQHLALNRGGKTGTSNQNTDNWFVGFSETLLTTVWVGSENMHAIAGNYSGSKLALPIWQNFIEKAQYVRPAEPWVVPEGVVSSIHHSQFGHSDPMGIEMYFRQEYLKPDQRVSNYAKLQLNRGYRELFTY